MINKQKIKILSQAKKMRMSRKLGHPLAILLNFNKNYKNRSKLLKLCDWLILLSKNPKFTPSEYGLCGAISL